MARRAEAVGRYATVLALLTAAGCVMWQQESEQDRSANTVIAQSYTNRATENGVVAQHTLYPYHFVPDSTQLTAVGERDLKILAAHFTQAPGPLNVPKANTPDALHRARVEAVKARLGDQGVEAARVTIVDEMPGGPGMSSERVIQALESQKGDRQTNRAAGSSSSASKRPTTPRPVQAAEGAAR